MADAWGAEQAIEVLQAGEVRIVGVAVAPGHRAVVVDHAARIDELIVRADEGEELATVGLECVQRRKRIGHVGDIAGAILGYLRILLERYTLPVKVDVVLIPVKLGHAEAEGRRGIEDEEITATIQAEPDLLAARIARAVPDLVHGYRLLRREAIAGGGRLGAADVGSRIEMAGAGIVNNPIGDPIC